MKHKISLIILLSCVLLPLSAQTPQPIKRFMKRAYMEGASFSLVAKEVTNGETLYDYEGNRQLTPASVMKLVTTSTALEILGEEYRFATSLEYDGTISQGVLQGNLYIKGGGDPTLGSSYFAADRSKFRPDQNKFIPEWLNAIREAGIREIKGAVIADEHVFDTEGISSKWQGDDLGNYYAAGSYGLSVFDNLYKLTLRTGAPGTRPEIKGIEPHMPNLRFHNYLSARSVPSDSSFIMGSPFSGERYLYGVVPAHAENYILRGDIPDPALFLAEYLTGQLQHEGISVSEQASCYRLLSEAGNWDPGERKTLTTTYSPPLATIVGVINQWSHNLFADALIKQIGTTYKPGKNEVISSFERGIRVLRKHWENKGLNLSSLWMYDGSGLAASNKLSAAFVADLLIYMAQRSSASGSFMKSLPEVGVKGSVRNFLKGTALQGKATLKSGSMNRVKGYAGYISKEGKTYAVSLFVNNYACSGRTMNQAIEQLLLSLF